MAIKDECFNLLSDKEILQVVFVQDYFQIYFDRGILTSKSETFIKTPEGEFQVPSMEGNWHLYKLINRHVLSVEDHDKFVLVKVDGDIEITIDTCLEGAGENFSLSVEGVSSKFL